jgi:hypothetical protein
MTKTTTARYTLEFSKRRGREPVSQEQPQRNRHLREILHPALVGAGWVVIIREYPFGRDQAVAPGCDMHSIWTSGRTLS